MMMDTNTTTFAVENNHETHSNSGSNNGAVHPDLLPEAPQQQPLEQQQQQPTMLAAAPAGMQVPMQPDTSLLGIPSMPLQLAAPQQLVMSTPASGSGSPQQVGSPRLPMPGPLPTQQPMIPSLLPQQAIAQQGAATMNPVGIQQQQQNTPPNTSRSLNLFVAGLLPTTTEDDLKQLFSPYGDILSTKLMLDTRTGASRGFGFILFSDAESGHRALAALNGQRFGSARLHINVSQHDGKIGESSQLYIRNIPLDIEEEEIRKYFFSFGETTLFVLRTGNGSFGADGSRQTQHLTIQYVNLDDAKRALAACHGSCPFPNSKAPILAKFSESTHTRISRRANRDRNKAAQGLMQNGAVVQTVVPQQQVVYTTGPGGVPQQCILLPPGQQPMMQQQQQQFVQQPMVVPQQQQQQQFVSMQQAPPPSFTATVHHQQQPMMAPMSFNGQQQQAFVMQNAGQTQQADASNLIVPQQQQGIAGMQQQQQHQQVGANNLNSMNGTNPSAAPFKVNATGDQKAMFPDNATASPVTAAPFAPFNAQ